MNKLLELIQKLAGLQSVTKTGLADEAALTGYLAEREVILDETAKALMEVQKETDSKMMELETTIKYLRDQVKNADKPKVLSKDELHTRLGKALIAVRRRDLNTIGDMGFTPQFKADSADWDKHSDFSFTKGADGAAAHFVSKAGVGSPLPDTTGQYIIDPVIERYLLQEARVKSQLMGLVREWPMTRPEHKFPVLADGTVTGAWLSDYGEDITESEVSWGPKVSLNAKTYAVFNSWYDEWEEDADLHMSLGQLYAEAFAEAYGKEFDIQCLTASAAPFSGVFTNTGAKEYYVAGSNPAGTSYIDFEKAAMKIAPEYRANALWIVSETMLHHISTIKDANGNPVWIKPEGGKPGRIGMYPYVESRNAPQMSNINPGDAFAWFGDPNLIWHGRRKGIEAKVFDNTYYAMKNGQIFLRFRTRDAFRYVHADKQVLMKVRTK